MFSDKTIENKHMHAYKHTFPKCPLEGRAIVNTWLHHFVASPLQGCGTLSN